MRIALYARASTIDQHPEAQLGPLREYALRRGAEAVEYVDHGVSGRKHRRPAFDRLLAAVRRREVDAVAAVRLDRLARSTAQLCAVSDELKTLGVDLVILDQRIDTSTAAGQLLFEVLGAIAQFEANLIRERTRAGLEAARRRGKRLGRPRALDRPARERARRLRGSGKSLRYIAELLGVGKTTVARALEGVSE
jgi:DNA invertase Pin-like site-specific DNA recombinase